METRRIKSTSKLVTAIMYGSLMGIVVLFSLGNAERRRRTQSVTVDQARFAKATALTASDTADQASAERQIPGHPELDLQLD